MTSNRKLSAYQSRNPLGIILAATMVVFIMVIPPALSMTVSDSLRVEIKNAAGNKRIDLLNQLAEVRVYSKGNDGLNIAREALDLSVKSNYRKGQVEAYSAIGSYYILAKEYKKALDSYVLGLKAVDKDERLPVTGILYSKLGVAYSNLGMDEDSFRAMKTSLPLLEKDHNYISAGYVANYLGVLYWEKSNFDSSLVYYLKAVALREPLADRISFALTCNNIGIVYYQLGNFEKALEYYIKALRLAEEAKDISKCSLFLNNIGITYRDWGKRDDALAYFSRALDMSREVKNNHVIGYSLNNIGTVHEENGDFTIALDFYRKSLEFYKSDNSQRWVMMGMNSLGGILNKTGDYNAAFNYAEKALKIAGELKNGETQTTALTSMGVAYMNMHKYDMALRTFEESLRLSRAIGKRDQVKNNYLHLSEYYERRGDARYALLYFKHFTALKDSLYNETASKNIDHLKIVYETDKISGENELLRVQSEGQKIIIHHNRTILLLISVMLLVIAASAIVYHRLYRDKKKAFRLLQETNGELARQRDEIDRQMKENEAAFSSIKVLSGLLPICASCKKIRDDVGYWSEVETYISKHTDALFTHGICPDCIKKLYPDLDLET